MEVSAKFIPDLGAGRTPSRLSGRTTNQLHDVVQYEFTVVLPPKRLVDLCRHLMAQNMHTVLDVAISEPGKDDGGRSGAMSVQGNVPEHRYYYGTESVVQATITGELLMLAEWTRGPVDEKAGTRIKATALMPVEILADIRNADLNALRPADQKESESVKVDPSTTGRQPYDQGIPQKPATGGGGGRYGTRQVN